MLKIVLGLVFGFIMLYAETFTVNTLDDTRDGSCNDGSCSLRDAISLCDTNDTINIEVTGTIVLTGSLRSIYRTLTINGPGMNDLNISGNHLYPVFQHFGGTFSVNNLGIVDANSTSVHSFGGINSSQLSGYDSAELRVNSVLFGSNKSSNGGGAIITSVPTEISNSKFVANSSTVGGAIYVPDGNTTITRSVFIENHADLVGGGAIFYDYHDENSSHRLSECEFYGNYAVEGSSPNGGAIVVKANLNIDQSLFHNNMSKYAGGAVNITLFNALPVSHGVNINNSTFFGNTSISSWGGAISARAETGVINISFSTITQNQSHMTPLPSGGIFHDGGQVNIKSNVISHNYDISSSPAQLSDCNTQTYIGFNSLGSNVMASAGNCPLHVNDGTLGADQLELLADNGGPTKTCAPREGSMLVNTGGGCWDAAGNPVTVDQRGVPRSDGQCDIGAYEVNNFFGFTPILMYLLN